MSWKIQQGSPRLILVYNGFAMDEHPLDFLACPPNTSLAVVSDFRDLELRQPDRAGILSYDQIDLVAWSLGVWVWAQTAGDFAERLGIRVAINGTLKPLDQKLGIPPAIFALTRARFGPDTRPAFYERVCGSPEVLESFLLHQPQRSPEAQAAELGFLYDALQAEQATPETTFHRVLIGERDKIFPPASLQRFWQDRAEIEVIDSGHFPFFGWRSWEDVLTKNTWAAHP